MEVLAENYHNIWAKKKKSDLGSRGDLLMTSITDPVYTQIHANQRRRQCALVFLFLCVCGCMQSAVIKSVFMFL